MRPSTDIGEPAAGESQWLLLPALPQPPPGQACKGGRAFDSLATLCARCIAQDVTTSLQGLVRGNGWHFLTPMIRTQLLTTLAANGALSDALLEQLLRGGLQRDGALELGLSECVQVTDRGVAMVAESCAELRRLRLGGLSVSDEALRLVGMRCPQLAALHLSRCRRLTDGCVALLAQQLPLTELDVSFCRQLGDQVALSVLRHCPRLSTLRLDGTRVSDALLGSPPAGSAVGDAQDPARGEAQGSKADETQRRVQGGGTLGPAPELFGLSSLTALSMQGCRQLSETALQQLCRLAPQLEWLRLGATAAADTTVEAISESLPRLSALSLEGCPAVSDRALPLLMLGCPALASLDLSRCALVGTLQFHHSSHSLRELQLSHCAALTPAALAAVAESCEALSALWLEGCAALDDALVFELCQGCTVLQRLSLAHCDAITERAVFYVAMLRQIAQLCVCGCALLEDEQVMSAIAPADLEVVELPSRRVLWYPSRQETALAGGAQ